VERAEPCCRVGGETGILTPAKFAPAAFHAFEQDIAPGVNGCREFADGSQLLIAETQSSNVDFDAGT